MSRKFSMFCAFIPATAICFAFLRLFYINKPNALYKGLCAISGISIFQKQGLYGSFFNNPF